MKRFGDVRPPQFAHVHEDDKRAVPADCDMTGALGSYTFEKLVEFFWDIMPCASSERPVRLVQHCDVARWVGHEGKELHRVINQAEASLLHRVCEFLHIRDHVFSGVLNFACCCGLVIILKDNIHPSSGRADGDVGLVRARKPTISSIGSKEPVSIKSNRYLFHLLFFSLYIFHLSDKLMRGLLPSPCFVTR